MKHLVLNRDMLPNLEVTVSGNPKSHRKDLVKILIYEKYVCTTKREEGNANSVKSAKICISQESCLLF